MKLTLVKKLFLLMACTLMLGFTWVQNTLNRVEMESWPVVSDGQFVTPVSQVAIVQSDKDDARDLEEEDIFDLVSRAVELAGGLESIITDGDTVLLKPNLVTSNGRVPEVNGVTTDYRIVKAVAKLVRELNPNGTIIVFEGTALTSTHNLYRGFRYTKSYLPDVDEFIALEEVCGADKDYDSPQLVSVSLLDEVSLYPDNKKPNKSRPLYYAKLFYNADVIITLPCLKNHESAAVTCGIKNTSIGCTPPSVYSTRNDASYANLRDEVDHSFPNMHKWLHDFFIGRPTDFVIVDGLQGMQHGPGGGSNPAVNAQNMRVIMASKDLVSNDAIAALLMGIDPAKVEYLVYCHNDELGCADPQLIRVVGNASVSNLKKPFAHSDSRTKAAMYSDFKAPSVAILSVHIVENILNLQLDTSSETFMVEVEIDGQKLEQNVVSGFDNIQIDLPNVATGDHEVKVIAYDKYLNASEASQIITNVRQSQPGLADVFELSQNYPNPFNPRTTIRYQLPQSSLVTLKVFDVNGRLVETLVDGHQVVGAYAVVFDGKTLPSGLYFYTLQTDGFTQTRRMQMVK